MLAGCTSVLPNGVFKINVHSNGFIDNSTAATTIRAAVKE
jgi:hypothetical protein